MLLIDDGTDEGVSSLPRGTKTYVASQYVYILNVSCFARVDYMFKIAFTLFSVFVIDTGVDEFLKQCRCLKWK